jgi:hypothetical protein
MADSYPIIRYPRKIKQKLESQQSVLVEVEEIVNDNSSRRSDRDTLSLPIPYHKYLGWGLCGICLLFLGSLIFTLSTARLVAVVIGLSSTIGTAGYLLLEYRHRKLIKKHKNFVRSLAAKTQKRLVKTTIPIDWSDEVSKLVRSDKRSREGNTRRGVSEDSFLTLLLKTNLGNASFGYAYPIDGYDKPYTSDIEIILDNRLGIQVEIDEPYVGHTYKPHHCRDDDNDYNRDLYFLNNGWIIIRFSERQVVTNPNECCGYIAWVIMKLTGDISLANLAKSARNLQPDPRWSRADARVMAKNDERQKYLIPAGLWSKSVNKKIIVRR